MKEESSKIDGLRQNKKIRLEALRGITEIKPHLHRITLSGNYDLNTLQKKLGPFQEKKAEKSRTGGYNKMAYREFNGTLLTIFWDPKKKFFKKCRIELTFSSYRSIMLLAVRLPKLRLRSVEYSVDFLCASPKDVANLFYLFLRYMYFDFQKEQATYLGGKFLGWGEPRKENAVFKIGPSAKIYERGPDSLKKWKYNDLSGKRVQYWNHKDVNKVRVEFLFDREHKREKTGPKFGTLKELILDAGFEKRILHRFQFKVFENSDVLPKEWEDYVIRNQKGEIISLECFQDIYFLNRQNIKGISQYVKDTKGFKSLRRKLQMAMQKFDKRWIERGQRVFGENA